MVKFILHLAFLGRICALMEENPEFAYSALEERLDDQLKTLMSAAVFADASSEVLSSSQAQGLL